MTPAVQSVEYLADIEARHAQAMALLRHLAELEMQHVKAWTGGDAKGDEMLARLRRDHREAEIDAKLLQAMLALYE